MNKQDILNMFGGFIHEFNRDFEAVWANYCAQRLKADTGLNISQNGTSSPYVTLYGFNMNFKPNYRDSYDEFKSDVLNLVTAKVGNMDEAVIISNHANEFRMLNVLPEEGRITGKFKDVVTLLEVAGVEYTIKEQKNGRHRVKTNDWFAIGYIWQICRKI